ncbi:hypothetical protein PanWU01x14_116870 [Parasponia andersonii]|uniref:Uncharacterized protein n=1 Tax=Parasponia andersonii TaxID=3476 RepID=A0A2P5CWF6_PARAD|nr:hypothetical protein PanWU01x14_116870 [Parasponia andersonii]
MSSTLQYYKQRGPPKHHSVTIHSPSHQPPLCPMCLPAVTRRGQRSYARCHRPIPPSLIEEKALRKSHHRNGTWSTVSYSDV